MSTPSSRALVATTPVSAPAGKLALDLAPFFRQVAGAVGLDARDVRRGDLARRSRA